MQLREHKFDTPLFSNASLASAVAADRFENPAKYLVLNSKGNIDTAIFGQTNAIAPVYLHLNRSYISLEGECLWDYFRARRQSDLVLTEE